MFHLELPETKTGLNEIVSKLDGEVTDSFCFARSESLQDTHVIVKFDYKGNQLHVMCVNWDDITVCAEDLFNLTGKDYRDVYEHDFVPLLVFYRICADAGDMKTILWLDNVVRALVPEDIYTRFYLDMFLLASSSNSVVERKDEYALLNKHLGKLLEKYYPDHNFKREVIIKNHEDSGFCIADFVLELDGLKVPGEAKKGVFDLKALCQLENYIERLNAPFGIAFAKKWKKGLVKPDHVVFYSFSEFET